MNESADDKELVSALADGQLRGAEVDHSLDLLARDSRARQAWHHYHLIADVLRSPDLASNRGHDLPAQVMARLRVEPPPRRLAPAPAAVPVRPQTGHASNEGRYRWRVPGFMSLVAVAGLLAWVMGPGEMQPLQLAASPPVQVLPAPSESPGPAGGGSGGAQVVVVSGPGGAMLRSPHLDELLAAHRQLGDATVLQVPRDALHNAVLEAPAR